MQRSGTSQILSVPYALNSKSAVTLTGNITESQIIDLKDYLVEEADPHFAGWNKSTGSWSSSDARYKKNISEIDHALDRVMKKGELNSNFEMMYLSTTSLLRAASLDLSPGYQI